MDLYLFAPKNSAPQDLNKIYAEADFTELRKAIECITAEYKRKAAKDKSFQIPEAMISNLNEFNYL
ncbi:hypothetical protein MJO28_001479 [Puccinia striiformis f. sp. tritici]|nr:hypothetical protein MJO28_001479 [Puccinia striiformis f. sp. tritici]